MNVQLCQHLQRWFVLMPDEHYHNCFETQKDKELVGFHLSVVFVKLIIDIHSWHIAVNPIVLGWDRGTSFSLAELRTYKEHNLLLCSCEVSGCTDRIYPCEIGKIAQLTAAGDSR